MKSFIAWVGGKSLLSKKIIAEFPQGFGRYIEVFAAEAVRFFSRKTGTPTLKSTMTQILTL